MTDNKHNQLSDDLEALRRFAEQGTTGVVGEKEQGGFFSRLFGGKPNNKEPEESSTMVIDSVVDEYQVNGQQFRMEFMTIPKGRFSMGNPEEEKYAEWYPAIPVHEVGLESFNLGKYPVTQSQWQAVMGTNPSKFTGADRPVEQVSWDQVQEFIMRLNQAAGKKLYRLPSESEWEYACRAGSTTVYCFGDDRTGLGEYAWYDANSGDETHPVGQKRANAWGLHDMHGNVNDWCQDRWHDFYQGAPSDGSAWETGTCKARVVRGGTAWDFTRFCRSGYRRRFEPGSRIVNLGFRLARVRGQ